MKKLAVICFSLFCCLKQTSAQVEQNLSNSKPSIQVIGMGKVIAVPDAAEIVIVLRSREISLKSAINSVENESAALVKSIKKYLLDSNDIVIDLPNTINLYKWDQKLASDITTGYYATQKITINIRNLSVLKDFFKELFKRKIHEIERLSYFNTDESVYYKQVRQRAIKDGDGQTQEIAILKKVKLGKLNYLELNEVFVDQGKSSFYNLGTYDNLLDGQKLLFSTKNIVYACTVKMITEID